MFRLNHAARSDVGMIRSGNEDNFDRDVNANRGVFIVADGMVIGGSGLVSGPIATFRDGPAICSSFVANCGSGAPGINGVAG